MKPKLFDGFSWEGTIEVARREIYERRRTQLLRVGLMTSVFFVAVLLLMWACNRQYEPESYELVSRNSTESLCIALAIVFYLLYGLFAMLSGSLMFRELADKSKRILFLMLPESEADKYAGRFLVYVVIFSLVALISMIVALAVGWVIGNVIFDNLYSMKYLVNPVNKIFGSDIMGRCMVPATILIFMTASFFVLGSVSFPKYTFVKTYGVLVVLQIVVNTVLSTVLIAVVNTGALDLEMKLSSVDIVVITLSLLMILLMLFNWIMGYVWLRNTDVID